MGSPPDVPDEQLTAFLNEFRILPQGVSRETLLQRTGLDEEGLEQVRGRLEADGFSFEEDEEGRLLLAEKPDRLLPYWIKAGLRCDRIGAQIFFQEEVDSTQDIAFELMVEGRPHGTLVLAEHQTGARGRGEKQWFSTPHKGLQFSLLLDLEPPGTFASVLTIAIAAAIARSIQDVAGVPARIKFPNDVMVRGRKVAGVLLEVRDYGVPRHAVAGIGINVNQLRGELPEQVRDVATSLRIERRNQEPLRRSRLLRAILRELEKWLDKIKQDDFTDLENAWNRFCPMEGREVRFLKGKEEVRGRVIDAGIRDGLLVRLPDGEEKRYRLEHLTRLQFL